MPAPLKITYPRDGDVLTRLDGAETETGITIAVRGTAPSGVPLRVNGVATEAVDNAFSVDVTLCEMHGKTVAETDHASDEIVVIWNRGSRKRFRFSVDDNILFLKDLGSNPGAYSSLFDHWYAAFWRDMHREFGTKVHINIYYQTDGFDLSEMPDKWKGEWQDNASWLHLSFHALQDKPDRPYRNATYAEVGYDYDLVCGHIRRFAGDAYDLIERGVGELDRRAIADYVDIFVLRDEGEAPVIVCHHQADGV